MLPTDVKSSKAIALHRNILFSNSQDSRRDSKRVIAEANRDLDGKIVSEPEAKQNPLTHLSLYYFFWFHLGIFYFLFLFYRRLLRVKPGKPNFPSPKNQAKSTKFNASKDQGFAAQPNPYLTTVSKIQIAFSPQAVGLRKKLTQISSSASCDQDQDIVDLMYKTVLALVSQQDWTHVSYTSKTFPKEQVITEFDIISQHERKKCASKESSLANAYNQVNQSFIDHPDSYRYIVVTLILCTTHSEPLFDKIYTEEQLIEELAKLGKINRDSLIQFELLWNPQQEDTYLTNEELLVEYGDMIRLL